MRLRLVLSVAALVAALASLAAPPAGSAPARDLRPVPVLMYHVIAPPPAGAPYPGLYVLPADFRGQLAWLAAHGYRAVTLQRVYDAWRGAATLPKRPVVISFDDGYRSHVVNALPALRAHGWPGVLNLELRNTRESWGLSERNVRRLIRAGWEIDSHTIDHPDLTTLGAADLRHEVAGSRAALRRLFGVPASFFCYPAGRFDPTVVAAVQAAGYLGATTTEPGLASPSELFTMNRIRVDGSDGVRGLAARLQAATGR